MVSKLQVSSKKWKLGSPRLNFNFKEFIQPLVAVGRTIGGSRKDVGSSPIR